MRARKLIDPSDVLALVDTREQSPLSLDPLRSEPATLDTGDYSVAGLTHLVAVERKSLSDLVACCGKERERFDRCVQRLLAYECRALFVEATWGQIELGSWRSTLTPSHVLGSLMSWTARGLPVILAGDHGTCGRLVSRFLFVAARERWRQLQSLCDGLKIAGGDA